MIRVHYTLLAAAGALTASAVQFGIWLHGYIPAHRGPYPLLWDFPLALVGLGLFKSAELTYVQAREIADLIRDEDRPRTAVVALWGVGAIAAGATLVWGLGDLAWRHQGPWTLLVGLSLTFNLWRVADTVDRHLGGQA